MVRRGWRELFRVLPVRAVHKQPRIVGAVLALGLLVSVGGPGAATAMSSDRLSGRREGAQAFTLSAQVTGLFPNATLTAAVRVHNPQPFRLSVQTASVTVGDASPECPSTNLTARPFAGAVMVPSRGDAALPIELHMLASAPDTCQGASFPLTFAATGLLRDTSGPSTTAFTGSDTILFALVGLILLSIGICVLLATSRHRTRRRVA